MGAGIAVRRRLRLAAPGRRLACGAAGAAARSRAGPDVPAQPGLAPVRTGALRTEFAGPRGLCLFNVTGSPMNGLHRCLAYLRRRSRGRVSHLLALLALLAISCGLTPVAHAADALNGKSLYLNGPVGG